MGGDIISENPNPESEILRAWRAVPRIGGSGVLPASLEELMQLVEEPLQESCTLLYERNIQTLSSGCNEIDRQRGYGGISLSWDSLSQTNRLVARELPFKSIEPIGQNTDGSAMLAVHIRLPIAHDDFPRTVAEQAAKLAERFEWQPMTWAPRWSLDEARRNFKMDGHDLTTKSEEELRASLKNNRLFVDPQNTIWLSEEHWHKATQSV